MCWEQHIRLDISQKLGIVALVVPKTQTSRAVTRLRIWRAQRNWTLEEVAGLAGKSAAMISMVERGKRRLSPKAKVELARAVGAKVAELFPPEER